MFDRHAGPWIHDLYLAETCYRDFSMTRLIFVIILSLVCAGCLAPMTRVKPALSQEGEVFLYLEPFSPDVRPLRFGLAEVSAVRNDGVEVPLTLRFTEIKGEEAVRQRLLASGVAPPGAYQGFSFKVRQAFLKKEGGEASLTVPDHPERVAFPVEVKRKRGSVFSVTLPYKGTLGAGSMFHPAFSIVIPERPLNALTGYVTNTGSNNITVFDKRAGSVRKVIETGQGPMGMALDQKGLKAYVAISGEDAIEVVDVLADDVINRIKLIYGDHPSEIALTPDGKTLLAINPGSNTLSFVDPTALLETSRLNVGKMPVSLLLDPAGKKGYVFNYISNTITVIDIGSRSVSGTIPTEPAPLRGAFNKQGDKLLVIHEWSPNLIVIDPITAAITKRIYVGIGSYSLKVDTLTDRIYLSRRHDPTVEIYDPFSLIPGDFLKAAGGTRYMLFDGDTNSILLVLPEQKALQTINLISKKAETLIDVGDEPYWATIMGERY
jgi:YVTN family beta-propeller protein